MSSDDLAAKNLLKKSRQAIDGSLEDRELIKDV